MKSTWKMARKLASGRLFLEVPAEHWDIFERAWQYDNSHPCPMPVGHRMFRQPREYGCSIVGDIDAKMLIDACTDVCSEIDNEAASQELKEKNKGA